MTKVHATHRPPGRTPTMAALATTAVLWASAFPAIKSALEGYGVAGLSFLRLFVASLALVPAAPILKVRVPGSRDLPLIAVCGLAGMSAYQVLLNWGEVRVPAGTASLLVSVAPVFSVILAAAFLGERLSGRVVLGSVVAIAGSVLIAVAGGKAGYTAAAWVVLAAALVQGLYHFASKPLLRRYSAVEVACYSMWSGTVFLAPLAPAAFEHMPAASATSSASVLLLGLLPSAVGFVTWGYAVSRSTVSAATAALYLVPVIAIAVSFAWLGEVPTLVEIFGGMISIGGVVLIRLQPRARTSSSSEHAVAQPDRPPADAPALRKQEV